jgi:hypothetical protein
VAFRVQSRTIAPSPDDQPVAIVFDFVHPLRTGRRL